MTKTLLFFLLLDLVFDVQLNTNLLKGKQNEALQNEQRQKPPDVHQQCGDPPAQFVHADEGRHPAVRCPATSPSEAS